MNLKALIVEDSDDDLFLLLKALKSGGFKTEYTQVQTEEDFIGSLKENWDVVISDYSLPTFSGVQAAKIVRQRNIQVPFFIVSGTIGEATAVEVMKAGAQDYVMKDNLTRLVPAIVRELREFENKRQMQNELVEKEEQLRQAQKMEAIGRLAGGIAHDFNNLLGVLMLASENVQSKVSQDPDLAEDVEQIQIVVQRAAALTRQLLTFSRKQVVEPRPVDVNAMVSQTQKLLTRILGEDIHFEARLTPDLPRVHIDPSQFEQILMNLIVNARDAMPKGGRLTVMTERTEVEGDLGLAEAPKSGTYVTLVVSDSGIGMNEETQQHMFEPFFTTKGPDRGTGLGLSNVFGIVKQSHGIIRVDSTLNKGTDFRILLPAVDEKHEIPQIVPNKSVSLQGTERILLVEDQGELRSVIEQTLRAYKYEVLSSDSSLSAIEQANRDDKKIDLLLTDLIMPDMNGYELAQNLCQKRPDLKVLLMSGYLDDRLVQFPQDVSQRNFIQKPFSSEELLKRLRRVLDRV